MSRPGDFRHRITIERSESTAEAGSGQRVKTWVTLLEVWARREQNYKGNEAFFDGSNRDVSRQNFVYTIRYRRDVSIHPRRDRVVHDGEVYDILTVADRRGRSREIELLCELVK